MPQSSAQTSLHIHAVGFGVPWPQLPLLPQAQSTGCSVGSKDIQQLPSLFPAACPPPKGASQSGRFSPETQPRGCHPTAASEHNICPRLPRGKPNQSEFAQRVIEPSCSPRQEEDVRAVLRASIQGSASPDSTQRDLFSSGSCFLRVSPS